MTISTDNLLKTDNFRNGEAAQWPFLSDPEQVVQLDLGIQESTRRIRPDSDTTTEEMRVPGNTASGTDSFHMARDFGRSGQTRSGRGGIFRSNVALHNDGRCGKPDGPYAEQYRS